MMSCLRPLPSTSTTNNYISSPASQEFSHSVGNTPTSSSQISPTVNLTQEYRYAVETNSFGEIRNVIHQDSSLDQYIDLEQADFSQESQLLEKVLQPNRESIQDALSHITPNTPTKLVDTYFQHSEHTCLLCLHLYQGVHRARLLYTPLSNLLDDLPLEFDLDSYSISDSQCNWAFDIFLRFDSLDNPFLSSGSHNFDDMRQCFTQLRQQLGHRLKKSNSRVHVLRRTSTGCAVCLIAATVGVAISAVVLATHALVALVAIPICPTILLSNMSKKEKAHLAQLDAAAQGAYVLHKHLDTIDRLVARLCTTIENDKLLIRLGLSRRPDRHAIQEVLKQLQRNRSSFEQQLMDLEEHLLLCFLAINRARSLLLKEILLHNSLITNTSG
ncbi:UPF0496 protein At3g19330-like [Olea europaea var. sylvestris]|uniref:Uncharacterized protein n=1 Tax=Olea europaea subsp. europaea TaxID=158383 RepID=A0A8S0PWT7_OLEEU|nr:UPF0496 protein At3g19330-like [Olea europaea var. sylvestris]XP_022887223.1 UPF0496 protein At3g19330-like [Olea europaea var. sylvestris]XP_022887224.1 UPF0496 protein At3g19330-like [Olea europaea var. sylvestris]XP_022887225.1 UPF0496 protein At3g19330-like [Olea europaea var. sylvestris]CAA2957744.1 Hypothetical predicted protein [Olea europaea subsp. europaea]